MRAIVLLLFATTAHAEPPGLACLAKHYALTPVFERGRWQARIGTTLVPWDDEKDKTLDEALDHPDLQDTLARRYVTGPIRPITDPDEDPGRVRVDALFKATYPSSGIVKITFAGHRLPVHERVADAFRRVDARLAKQPALKPWLVTLSGTLSIRTIAGTTRPSSHSYGVSIDLDSSRTDYWRRQKKPSWRNTVPQALVDAFEAEGFIWGGRWFHYDTMHFEYRPELLDPACYRIGPDEPRLQ